MKKDSKNKKYYNAFNRCEDFTNTCKQRSIEDESFLLHPENNSKQKSQILLKNKIQPFDYNTDLQSNNLQMEKNIQSQYGISFTPGKGFGNLNVNNSLRNGINTREIDDDMKKKDGENITTRFDYITKNYQNPDNLILPFARGGEITRNNNTLDNSKFKENIELNKKIKFKY